MLGVHGAPGEEWISFCRAGACAGWRHCALRGPSQAFGDGPTPWVDRPRRPAGRPRAVGARVAGCVVVAQLCNRSAAAWRNGPEEPFERPLCPRP